MNDQEMLEAAKMIKSLAIDLENAIRGQGSWGAKWLDERTKRLDAERESVRLLKLLERGSDGLPEVR